jgi:hypothetical protein
MALAIRVLGFGQMTTNLVIDLSTVAVPTGKAQIVKAMRFVNTSTSTSIGLNVLISHSSSQRQISPKPVTIAPGAMYIDDTEFTLEAGDKVQGSLSATGTVDYVISGIERDA